MNYSLLIEKMEREGATPSEILDEIVRLEACPSWAEARQIVLQRDGNRCAYCRETTDNPHIDHVLPRSRGGTDEVENLVVSCAPCNLSKGARTPEGWRSETV